MKQIVLGLWLAMPSIALSQNANQTSSPMGLQIAFGPQAGIGSTSDQTELRFSSGFRLMTNYNFAKVGRVTVGSGLGFSNSFANVRAENDQVVEIRDYDHRTLLVGLQAAIPTANADYFVSVHGGPSSSKLTVDRSADNLFAQKSAGGVEGLYSDLEIGAHWPVQEDFVITTSLLSTIHKLNHENVNYSGPQEVRGDDGKLTLTTDSGKLTDDGIAKNVFVKTFAASLGVAVLL